MKRNKSFMISYMQLRTLIGVLGMLLPFICVGGAYVLSDVKIYDSISMYYYSNMRDVFVGILVCVSLFLMTYKGYESIDNVITKVSGIAGFCIAIFPCENLRYTKPVSVFLIGTRTSNYIHLFSAVLFFALLAINSIVIFTKSDKKVIRNTRKYYRNMLFRISGFIILASLAVLILATLLMKETTRINSRITLITEIIMLFSFGISWLVKGGALLKEEKQA
jgi:uncharacterized membrane protein